MVSRHTVSGHEPASLGPTVHWKLQGSGTCWATINGALVIRLNKKKGSGRCATRGHVDPPGIHDHTPEPQTEPS